MWPQLTSMIPLWQWLVLGAVPPAIVALYFLKLRREPLVVPSTYLWRKSIEDLHVNSFWQRLRRSILLLLQLLLLLLLLLALTNPTWEGEQLSGNRFIFLLDNSASMSATDVAADGAKSRLELAKRRITEMVGGLKEGDSVMLITFADRAETVQEPTTNHREMLRRLATVEPSQRQTSINDALRAASGQANSGRKAALQTASDAAAREPAAVDSLPATLVVFSDFQFPDEPDSSVGNLQPKRVAIGRPDATNVAITSFAARRYEDRPKEQEAVAVLRNYSDKEAAFTAVLTMEDKHLYSREVTIPPGGQKSIEYPLTNIDSGVLKLQIDARDDLAVDNTAYAVVNPPGRGRVLFVSPGDEALRRALKTPKADELADITRRPISYLLTDEYQRGAEGGVWDLIIYDRCAPKAMPHGNTVFIGQLPPDKRWKAGEKVVNPKIVDIERTHPLVQFIDVGDFVIAEVSVLQPPPGGTSLFDAAEGSIFAVAPREGFQDAVLGFEISSTNAAGEATYNTNWPLRQSFPVFIHDLLSFLGSGALRAESESVRPGRPLEVRSLVAGVPAEIITPGGKSISLPASQQPSLLFTGTDETGIYSVRQGKAPTRSFAVNLFSPEESDIRVQPDRVVKLADAVIESGKDWLIVRRPIVKPLLMLALAVLMIEWYIYNRRVYV